MKNLGRDTQSAVFACQLSKSPFIRGTGHGIVLVWHPPRTAQYPYRPVHPGFFTVHGCRSAADAAAFLAGQFLEHDRLGDPGHDAAGQTGVQELWLGDGGEGDARGASRNGGEIR